MTQYKQITDFCFGEGRLTVEEVKPIKLQALTVLKQIKFDVAAGKLPILSLSNETNDLKEIEEFAAHIKNNFENLIILGTGGSSLCGHVLTGFHQNKFKVSGVNVIFMENIDPKTFSQLFSAINLSKTAFLTISKSGNSIETIAQFFYVIANQEIDPAKQIFAITSPGANPLRDMAAKLKIKIFDHNPNVGGRFSILSLAGLIPGIIAGIDARKLRAGAFEFLEQHAETAATSASIHIALMRKNIWQNVLMTYPDRLEDFNTWYRQIWAESLGKNGTGSTPVKAMGTIDQHSQMQLYLGGRRDKFFNFIIEVNRDNFKLTNLNDKEFVHLNHKTLADLMNAEQQATIDILAANNRPVRVIKIGTLNDTTLGYLIMHAMLETIITAHLLGVNPYDQPAVEAGKIKTRELMSS